MLKNNFKLPKREKTANKGDFGKVYLLAGSSGMLGAAILCSRAALRAGAGLVYLNVPNKSSDIVNVASPEVIITSKLIDKPSAIAVGPGLGERRREGLKLLELLSKKRSRCPIVLDADGLNAFTGQTQLIKQSNLNLILTPHPGELARLIGSKIDKIQKSRRQVAIESAKYFNCIVVLKGDQTVIADQNGNLYINQTGNPGMATAGVGDVLTGLIAGLAAQGLSAWEAATTGVHLHGLAGDLAAKDKGEYGMIASDILENIPYALKKFC